MPEVPYAEPEGHMESASFLERPSCPCGLPPVLADTPVLVRGSVQRLCEGPGSKAWA